MSESTTSGRSRWKASNPSATPAAVVTAAPNSTSSRPMTSRTIAWSSTSSTRTPSSGESCVADRPKTASISPDSAGRPWPALVSYLLILDTPLAPPNLSRLEHRNEYRIGHIRDTCQQLDAYRRSAGSAAGPVSRRPRPPEPSPGARGSRTDMTFLGLDQTLQRLEL